MPDIYPDFQEGLWVSVSDALYEAETIGTFGVGIIRPVVIPSLIDEIFLRLEVTSSSARSTWRQGLTIHQIVDSFAGSEDIISRHSVLLNSPQIFQMIDYPDGYRLRLNFYPWFQDVRVKVDKFII